MLRLDILNKFNYALACLNTPIKKVVSPSYVNFMLQPEHKFMLKHGFSIRKKFSQYQFLLFSEKRDNLLKNLLKAIFEAMLSSS